MADHNDPQSVVRPVLKGNQSSAFQLFQGFLHINIALMGVCRGSSMSGEVFVHADNPLVIQPFQLCRRHPGYQLRIRAERTVFHHLICRIGQHVRIRRRVHIKAQIFQIGSDDAAGLICLLRIAAGAYFTHIADLRHAEGRIASHSCYLSAFFVHGQENGKSAPGRCVLLGVFKHGPGLIRIFQILSKINQTSHRMFFQSLSGTVSGLNHCPHSGQGFGSNHKELVYFLFQRHRLQHPLNPCFLPRFLCVCPFAGHLCRSLYAGFRIRRSKGKGAITSYPFLSD